VEGKPLEADGLFVVVIDVLFLEEELVPDVETINLVHAQGPGQGEEPPQQAPSDWVRQ
jgi:hypothetical protein